MDIYVGNLSPEVTKEEFSLYVASYVGGRPRAPVAGGQWHMLAILSTASPVEAGLAGRARGKSQFKRGSTGKLIRKLPGNSPPG